jgi:hypothetical protein
MELSGGRALSRGLIGGFFRSSAFRRRHRYVTFDSSFPSEVQASDSTLFPSIRMTTLVKDCDDNDPVVRHHEINRIWEPMKQGSPNPFIEFGELQWERGDPLDQLT